MQYATEMNTATRVANMWLGDELTDRAEAGETINAELIHNILRIQQYGSGPDSRLLQGMLSVAMEQVDCQRIAELYQPSVQPSVQSSAMVESLDELVSGVE